MLCLEVGMKMEHIVYRGFFLKFYRVSWGKWKWKQKPKYGNDNSFYRFSKANYHFVTERPGDWFFLYPHSHILVLF